MKISILGTGAFGTALASIFYNNKCNIKMWTNSEDEMNTLLRNRKSDKINYNIPSDIIISTDMKEVVLNTDIIVVAVPAKFVVSTSKELNKYFKSNQVICIASKGIEQNSCLFLYDIIRSNIDTLNIGVISGGTFAEDIINMVPVGFSLASRSNYTRNIITKAIVNDYVKIYVPTEELVDISAEISKLNKELELSKKQLIQAKQRLENEKFISKAPKEVVDGAKDLYSKLENKIKKLENTIKNLSN